MNGVSSVLACDRNQRFDIQVRPDWLAAFRRPDQKCFIGLEAVQREAILVAVDRHRTQPELGGSPEAANRDLGSIGDEQFFHEP